MLGGALLAVLTVLLLAAVMVGPATGDRSRRRDSPRGRDRGASTASDPLTRQIEGLQQQLKTSRMTTSGWATLGIDYIQQAKDTVDPAYYPKAAGVLQRSLALDSTDNFVAMAGMANLRAAEHRFAEALAWAERAQRIAPYNSTIYGALADAYTQLGRYDEATRAVQRMTDLSRAPPPWRGPSTSSSSGASWIRPGPRCSALCDDATTPAEQAFAHYYLGELAFARGDAQQALAEHEAGLRADPGYPDLLAGKAKAEAALGRQPDALRDYAAVVARVPQPQYVIEAGEYLQSLGRTKEAEQDYALFAAENELFTSNGVQLDVDPTLFYADHGKPALALQYGQAGIAHPAVPRDGRRLRLGTARQPPRRRGADLGRQGDGHRDAQRPVRLSTAA